MTSTYLPGLRAQTLRGFVLVAVQRAVSLLVTMIGGILLARLLVPDVFGAYAIIGFAVGIALTFGDLGLGAALVQRRDLDLAASLAVAFTVQIALAATMGLAIAGFAPAIALRFGLPPETAAPLRCLALLIPLSALKMPSVVLLERNLTYLPLTVAETADTVVYHGVAALAALAGAGVWSFVLGAVTARITGATILWMATRWRPTLRWRWADLEPILRFGLLFQGNAVITVIRDSVVPTFVAASSGIAAVGFLNWAAAVSFLPLQFVTVAGKVLFPALSRLQQSPREFAEATERALNRVVTLLYPAAFLLLAGAESVIRPIYGERWVPAVPAVRLFCVTAIIGGTSNLLVHALYSFGRADIVFRLNLLWSAMIWGMTLLLVPRFGFVGFSLASALVSTTGVLTLLALRRLVPVRILPPIRVPLTAAGMCALLFAAVAKTWIHGIVSLAIVGSMAAALYAGLVCILGGAGWRAELLADWRKVWERAS